MPEATLQEQRLQLAADMRTFHTEHEDNWDSDADTNWEVLNSDYQSVMTKIETENAAESARLANEANAAAREELLAGIDSYQAPAPRRLGNDGAQMADFGGRGNTNLQALALRGWLKSGSQRVGPEAILDEERVAAKKMGVRFGSTEIELRIGDTRQINELQRAGAYVGGRYQNALTTQTGTTGGFTVGEEFSTALETAMIFSGSILQHSEIIRTASGEPFFWPTANDLSNKGRILGENNPVAELQPVFGRQEWRAYKWTSDEVLVPSELLDDSLFNMAQVLGEMLGVRIGRAQNEKYTLGIGGSEPMGLVTASIFGSNASGASSIAFDDLIDLEHSVDPIHRVNAGYTFHDNILLALRKLKDLEGRYLWQAGANTGAPDTLNTWPYWINSDMASVMTTGAKTVIFGMLSQYKVRQVGSVRLFRLVERHRENDQDAFLAFARGDGNLLNAGDDRVKHLLHPA